MSSSAEKRFVVEIVYTEPTYALRKGGAPERHRGSFELSAGSESEAIRLAKAEFRRIEQLSSVSWPRRIEETECRRVG